jgi:flagellar hook assembly protein FlgD
LKNPVTVSISIVKKDSSGQEFLVRTIAEDIRETKGTHRHTWLGDNEKGLFAPIGTYIGIVQIDSQRFEATVLVFHF